jgi:aminoglycoside 6'-N-acetyltransferase I
VEIKPLTPRDIPAAAHLLVDGFAVSAPDAWPTLGDAVEEMHECFEAGRLVLGAYDTGDLAGWVGGRHTYAEVWELHPLVVRAERRHQGIGRALVEALEREVSAAGGGVIMLGSDDETGTTSIFGVDLYPDPLEKLRRIRNLKDHPYSFYEKCGFVISGVVPDANGPGQHDILMCKRVTRA